MSTDFDGLPVSMTFDSCGSVCVNITVVNDLVLEKTENISLILKTNDSRMTLEQESTYMSIIDNEGMCVLLVCILYNYCSMIYEY